MKDFTLKGPFGKIECVVNGCPEKSAPILIIAHGFRGSREGGGRAVYLAGRLENLCHVVRFNFNGSQLLSRQVAELKSVTEKVREMYPENKIFLMGRSMGGAAALITAAQDRKVAGLILWAAPNNLRRTFRAALGGEHYDLLDSGISLHLADERGEITLSPEFLTDTDKYDLSALLAEWKERPILFLHGEADETVNVEQARKNFALAGGDKEIQVFPGGDHTFTECNTEAAERIAAWLERLLSL